MEQPTELTKTVNKLLEHGYRCQASAPDLAVLTKERNGQVLNVITVTSDGKVNTLPLSVFLETILNG
jgi:hypothetical protein